MRVLTLSRPARLLIGSGLVLVIAVIGQLAALRLSAPAISSLDPAASTIWSTTSDAVALLQERLRRNANDVEAYAQLGWAWLQRVRETGDASLYGMAEQVFEAALERDPNQIDAMTGLGSLALSRHQFYEALEWGQRATALNPYRAQVYGILGDAYTELGDYERALAAVQKMVDTRPDIASYSRVSYQRELRGDVEGALAAMQQAVNAGQPAAEATLWAQYQLGNLYFNRGDLDRAAATYGAGLQARSDYVYAHAGLARVNAAQGRYDEAIEAYQSIVSVLPLSEFVIALGDLYEASGRPADAKRQYDLVAAIQQLSAGAGVDVDLELALFSLDHGLDLASALEKARLAYGRRPSIYAADVLAWAYYQNARYAEARQYSIEARRLGTRDALLHFHAGLIELALGDRAGARQQLAAAVNVNPYFSLRYGPQAQALLEQLSKD